MSSIYSPTLVLYISSILLNPYSFSPRMSARRASILQTKRLSYNQRPFMDYVTIEVYTFAFFFRAHTRYRSRYSLFSLFSISATIPSTISLVIPNWNTFGLSPRAA